MESQHSSRWARRAVVPVALALAAATLAGCSSTSSTGAVKQNPKSTIVVWADAARAPAFKAFDKAHPNVKVKVEVIDPSTYLSKIQLANKVGSGWPDVIFDSVPSEIASLQSPLFKYAQPLDSLVPKTVQDNFATKNALCTIGGKLYCLQNDLAQDVLWYNKPLLEQFGYSLPTTWDEYKALGDKVAAEHPGYVIGASGSSLFYDFLWSSGCPLALTKGSTETVINTKDAKCTRVTDMLDPLIANGSVSRLGPFDADFTKLAQSGKVLMTPAASWVGEYVFKPATGYAFAPGTLAAGAMPTWSGEKVNWSGAQGGGIYVVSSHSANLKNAVAVAQYAATNTAFQITSGTYPAYIPAAKEWVKKVSADPFYAEDPAPVLIDAASKINPAVLPVRYDIQNAITNTIGAAVLGGKSIASAMPTLQSQLAGLAGSSGYAVVAK